MRECQRKSPLVQHKTCDLMIMSCRARKPYTRVELSFGRSAQYWHRQAWLRDGHDISRVAQEWSLCFFRCRWRPLPLSGYILLHIGWRNLLPNQSLYGNNKACVSFLWRCRQRDSQIWHLYNRKETTFSRDFCYIYVTFSRDFSAAKINTIIEISKHLSDYLLIYTDN